MKGHLFLLMLCAVTSSVCASDLGLTKLLEIAYKQNSMIRSREHAIKSLDSSASAVSFLSKPSVGISELDRGNKTKYWTIAQKIDFPNKYYLKNQIENKKKEAKSQELEFEKLKLRSKVITLYYKIFAVQKITALTKNDLQNVKEFSRIAESKYAAGKTAMHNTMKSHVLQTQLEADIISLKQEEESLQAQLRYLLNQPKDFRISQFPKGQKRPPILLNKSAVANSFLVTQKKAEYDVERLKTKLSAWQFAPDFAFKYQKRISGEPDESEIVSFEMTFPLWFWTQNSSYNASRQQAISKNHEYISSQKETEEKARELYAQVDSQHELLGIMNSGLIPQAQTSLSATLDAYKANQTSFLELIDAERSYLKSQIAYYRLLSQYVSSITELETTLGKTVSNLAN